MKQAQGDYQRFKTLALAGILIEDAVMVDLEDHETAKLVVRSNDMIVVGYMMKHTDLTPILDVFQKGTSVEFTGFFRPTSLAREEDTDTWPFVGTMIITHCQVA